MILFFGRLNITKGPDKFVLAAKEILKERKDLTFVLLGPDEGMKPTIESMIKDLESQVRASTMDAEEAPSPSKETTNEGIEKRLAELSFE